MRLRKRWIAWAVLAAGAAGCSGPEPKTDAVPTGEAPAAESPDGGSPGAKPTPEVPSSSTKMPEAQPPVPSPVNPGTGRVETKGDPVPAPSGEKAPPAGKKIPDVKTPKMPAITIPEQTMRIRKPGTDGWVASKVAGPVLGRRMDEAMGKLVHCLVDGRTTYETSLGTLVGKPQLKIESQSKFSLDFQLPTEEATTRILRGNGSQRAQLTKDGWKAITDTGGSLSAQEIRDWPTRFPLTMLARISHSKKVFEPLFTAWSADKGLAKKVDSRTSFVQGQNITFYRIVASRKEGNATLDMEVVMDGSMNLPVTIRSVVSRPGRKPERMMWTGQWAFGGKHDAASFELPSDLK